MFLHCLYQKESYKPKAISKLCLKYTGKRNLSRVACFLPQVITLSYLPQIFYDHKLSFPLVEEEEDIKSMLHVWECYRLITSSSPAWFGRWETSPVLCRVSLEQGCCGLDSEPWLHTGCCCSLRADTMVMVAWGCILGTAWENITEGALAWKQQLVSPPHHHSSAVPLTSAELQHSWFSVTWEKTGPIFF